MNNSNRTIVGMVLVLVSFASQRAFGAPASVEANRLRQNLYSTCFVTQDEGWAVGDLGRIFHTTNGGLSWEIQNAGTKRPFVAITCLDGKRLWAAGQAGQVAATSDGGKTWQMLDSGTDRQLLDIDFGDENVGIAVGDYGRIIRTADGGKTWTTIAVPPDTKLPPDIAEVVEPGDILFYSVHFADPQHVWVVGEFGVILASSDGGQTFVPQASPVESTLFGVFFLDAQRGWATGMEATLLQTTDGGATWSKVQVDTPRGFALAIYDVAVDGDSNVGWAVGNNGFLLNSMDAGQSWQRVDVPVALGSTWLRGVTLVADGRGSAVGSNGMVISLDQKNFKPMKERF